MSTAPATSRLLDPHSLAQLKGLTLRARRVVDGVLQGIHRSPHHGSSIEFAEHKEYSPGDEIRHIDWRAYGRLDKYYVKKFEHETNLRAWCLVDTSGSMGYGADGGLTKLEYASVLAASLGFLILRQQDAVGFVAFAEQVRAVLPAKARLGHLTHFCEQLEAVHAEGGTELDTGLRRLAEQVSGRGMIFVLSDFFGEVDAALKLLRQLTSRGHDVTVFHILDGDELEFPFEEMVLFEGMETRRRLLVEPKLVRDRYLTRLAEHQDRVRQGCLEGRIDYVPVDTREAPEQLLLGRLSRADSRGGAR